MRIVKMLLMGLLVIVLNQMVLFLMALLLGTPNDSAHMLNLGFALVALPMAAATLLLAMLLKSDSVAAAFRNGGIWTIFLVIYYILIGMGNNNLGALFLTPTLYLMFMGTFTGPFIYVKVKAAK